jgi:hypothetical protein
VLDLERGDGLLLSRNMRVQVEADTNEEPTIQNIIVPPENCSDCIFCLLTALSVLPLSWAWRMVG